MSKIRPVGAIWQHFSYFTIALHSELWSNFKIFKNCKIICFPTPFLMLITKKISKVEKTASKLQIGQFITLEMGGNLHFEFFGGAEVF
jgi:hypothetical protein